MTGWHLAHFAFLLLWGGAVLTETVLELAARSYEQRRAAAIAHRAMDAWVELPLLAGLLVTGAVLTARTPMDAALGVKVAAGVGAVGLTAASAHVVRARAAEAEADGDRATLKKHTARIGALALAAAPLAGVALAVGGRRVGWW